MHSNGGFLCHWITCDEFSAKKKEKSDWFTFLALVIRFKKEKKHCDLNYDREKGMRKECTQADRSSLSMLRHYELPNSYMCEWDARAEWKKNYRKIRWNHIRHFLNIRFKWVFFEIEMTVNVVNCEHSLELDSQSEFRLHLCRTVCHIISCIVLSGRKIFTRLVNAFLC